MKGSDEGIGRGGLFDWLVVLLLLVTSLVSMVDRFALSLLLEPIKADMALTDAQLGLLTGVAFGLFYATLSLPMGWLADRWSRKATISVGIAVWGMATAASGIAANALQFAAARMFVGVGEAALAPCAYGIIHDRFPKHQLGRAMSVYQMGGMLGAGFAMFVAGIAYDFFLAHQGAPLPLIGGLAPWQQTFLALALPCIPVLLLIAAMKEERRPPIVNAPGEAPATSLLAAFRADWLFYFATFTGVAAVILVTYALLSWMPAILMREFQWSAVEVGSSYGTLVVIASIAGLVVGGTSVDLMARTRIAQPYLVLSLVVALLSLALVALFGLASDARMLLVVAAALHFVMATPIGIIPAYVQLSSPPAVRGQMSSVYVLAVNIFGQVVGPTAVGFISSLRPDSPGGLRHAVVIVSSLSLLGAILLLLVAGRARRPALAS
ncbi:hypothetical protein B2G71_00185 [Novosphingobium sp. PC22D]|nr:hypothetical protein B2G71_00185 [Novosphingobium sp. PC22D]